MGAPRKQGDCGHGVPWRQWSGGSGRWQAVRGAPVEAKEASYGVVWARGRVEEGAPRRPRRRRRPWWRRRPFPAQGARGACRSSSGRKERRVRTTQSSREWSRRVKGEGRARCGRPERHDVAVALRRPTSACAQGTAPRGEAERIGGRFGRTRWRGGGFGRGGRRVAGGLGSAGAEQGRERGKRERERE